MPGLVLEGLPDADARALLASVLPGLLDERVRDRIVAESGGNPLALLELPHGATAAELAGGFGVADPLPVAGRIERSFLRRIGPLPDVTRFLLLLAAAEPAGDPALLWRAAAILGISARSRRASRGRRAAHRRPTRSLSATRWSARRSTRPRPPPTAAAPTAPWPRPPTRAPTLTAGPGTGPRQQPGPTKTSPPNSSGPPTGRRRAAALAAAAAFLERAAALTLDPAAPGGARAGRRGGSGQAGAFDAALRLLAEAEAEPLDQLQSARADLLRGQIAFASSRGSDAPPLLLKAARRFEPLDAGLARETYLEALSAALFAGRFATAAACARRPQPHGPRTRHRSRQVRPTCYSMAWYCWSRRATRPRRRSSSERSAPPRRAYFHGERGVRWLWLGVLTAETTVGRRELGPAGRPPRSSSPEKPALSACFPSPSASAPRCTSSKASLPRPCR